MKLKKVDDRFVQSNQEAIWSVVLTASYFFLWYISAYGIGGKSVEDYTYIAGLPAWFVLSCIISPILFSIATAYVALRIFKEISLNGWIDK